MFLMTNKGWCQARDCDVYKFEKNVWRMLKPTYRQSELNLTYKHRSTLNMMVEGYGIH